MIFIPRNLLRVFRSVLRKEGPLVPQQPVTGTADATGLRLRACLADLALEYVQEGDFGQGSITFPAEYLKQWEGAGSDRITLSLAEPGQGQAEWLLESIPQTLEWSVPPDGETFPSPPAHLQPLAPSFLEALRQAVPCCSRDAVRFATHCILLDGTHQRIVATDGTQLLTQNFSLPWEGEVFLPALPLFTARDLTEEFQAAREEDSFVLKAGPWTMHFPFREGRRFPRIDQVIPKPEEQSTTLVLHKEDAQFLARTLPRLPGQEEEKERVTLDLGEEVVVRSRAESSSSVTEVVLARSHMEGDPLKVCVCRDQLGRALQLGLVRFAMTADKPIVCPSPDKTFVWMPLASSLVIPPNPQARRIVAGQATVAPSATDHKRRFSMSSPNGNGHAASNGKASANGNGQEHGSANGLGKKQKNPLNGHLKEYLASDSKEKRSVLEQAMQMRDQARNLAQGLSQLIQTLRQQRKQNRLVATTLSSLRSLKELAVGT